ncbi:MAG: 16S rRNA (uracil(1498)-N(3))-methyltransferase [Chitinophagaceae bacterium]|nr:16S rRNA (uracil(1498)-N(3))-methyltransferase [Chitinophagaceae bacterium]
MSFFYISNYYGEQLLALDEETSRHVLQVLRMKNSEKLNLTDGKGHLLICEIVETGKKTCTVRVLTTSNQQPLTRNVSIAISLLKNSSRFEWFLEKATEIGLREIIPLICDRTVKEKFRHDRMNAICISAMLQSQQCWLPKLYEPVEFAKAISASSAKQKFIAFCAEAKDKKNLSTFPSYNPSTIFIGPEGDFSSKEIELALQNAFQPVSLGETRLRTETAGVVAATLMMNAL